MEVRQVTKLSSLGQGCLKAGESAEQGFQPRRSRVESHLNARTPMPLFVYLKKPALHL